ncbi:MAG: ABC transporter permease [Actinomycetota bacterium]|nr:ABC transporter permease [Actinomycetota bacterium]
MTNSSTYLRYEALRTARNWPFLVLSLAFPLILLLVVGGSHRHTHLDGISFPLYYMVGMASWGAMGAVVATGARISAERQGGWTRQLRLTPLSVRSYLTAKVVTGYLVALLGLAVIYLAGAGLGVHLPATGWLLMTGLILVGLVPFALAGVALGHLLRPEVLGPAIGGLTSLLALAGGAWGPLLTGSLAGIAKALPSYWLVQASVAGLDRRVWGVEGWGVMAAWTLVLVPVAVAAYRRDTARV